jgi:outer membrane protein assembly factor BamA/autotransporter translocation and assembly factor TamB
LAVCLASVVLILLGLHTPPAKRYVLARVQQYLAKQNIDLRAGALNYNLFTLSASIDRVIVRATQFPDSPPFAQVGHADVSLSLVDLIRGSYVVRTGNIADVDIDLVVEEDGRSNIPGPPQTSPPQSSTKQRSIDYLIERFALSNGRLQYDNRQKHVAAVLPISSIRIVGDRLTRRHRVQLAAGAGDVAMQGREVDLNRVTGDLSFDRDSFDLSRLDINVNYGDLRGIQLEASANYNASRQRAQLVSFNVTSSIGQIDADGVLALDPQAGESHLNADISLLDSLALARALELPYAAATQLDGRVQARWPALDYTRATGDAKLSLAAIRPRPSRGVIPVAGDLEVSARKNVITASLTRARGAATTVDGRVSLTDLRALAGQVHAKADDLADVIGSVEVALGRPRGSLVRTPVGGSVVVDGTLGGTIDAPAMDVTVQAPGLAAGSVSGLAVNAQARYTPAVVTLPRADLSWQSVRMHASGDVQLNGRRAINLRANVDDVPIDAMLAALGHGDLRATGTVGLHATVAGTISNPQGRLTVRGTELATYGETLGTLALDARLDGRRLTLEQFQLDKPQPGDNGRLTGSGSFDLDRRAYDIVLNTQNVELLGLTLPSGAPVRAAVDLAARGHGTIDQPDGSATINLRNIQLRQQSYGDFALEASVADQRALIRASADQFNVTASAEMSTNAPYPGKAEATINDLDLASLPMKSDMGLAGVLSAHLNAAGNASTPANGSGSATIDRVAITWNDRPITVDGPATIRYADEQVSIDGLTVRALDSTVTVTGMLPLDIQRNDGELDVDAKLNLAELATYAPPSTGLTAEGDIALTGTIRGSARRIEPALTLTVDNASVNAMALKEPISGIGVQLTVGDGGIQLADLRAALGAGRLAASGSVPFGWLPQTLPVEFARSTGPAEMHATLTDLDLAALPRVPEKLQGGVSVRADLEAPRPEIASITGNLVFPDLRFDFNGLTLSQQDTSEVALANGNVSIKKFALDGTVGHVELSGSAGLLDSRPLDLMAHANLNAEAATTFEKKARVGGQTTLEIAATGTMGQPVVKGFLELADGRFALADPQIAVQGLQTRIDFTPERVTLTRLEGSLNGGTLSGSGGLALQGLKPRDVSFQIAAQDVGFDQPLNMRTFGNADIRVTQNGDDVIVGGQIAIKEAGLTQDLNLDTGIFAYLNAPRTLELTQARNSFLEHVRFNLMVKTDSPMLIDNNLAKAQIAANLRVLGTIYETGMSGQLQVEEGSVLTLNERQYYVQRGVVNFIDDRRIGPSVDVQLGTTAKHYDITIDATGTPGELQTTLMSDPSLPEPDIMALLVTGRTLDEMRGQEFEVARNQVFSYLGGRVGSTLGRSLEHATGLSTVKIEPNVIASEAEPTARLSVGQNLTDDLSLVYSTDLVNSADHIWIAEYDVTRRFVTRSVRQSDGSFRFDFRHDVRFGGEPEPRRTKRTQPVIASVSVKDAGSISEEAVRAAFKVKVGDKYDFFKVRKGVQRVNALYERQNRLQSRVRLDRVIHDQYKVDLTLRITAGPEVTLVFEGSPPPRKFVNQARALWHRGFFDTQRAEDIRDALKGRLVEQRYLDPKIEYTVDPDDQTARRVTFRVDAGTRFDHVDLVFAGAHGIAEHELRSVVKDQKLGPKVYTDPEAVTDLLQRLYRERGFLDAVVEAPELDLDPATRHASARLPVHEGPQYTIRDVVMTGNHVLDAKTLTSKIPSVAGDPYRPAAAELSLTKLRELYWGHGYNEARPEYQVAVDREQGVLDLRFNINEGKRSVVETVQVSGAQETTPDLVRSEVEIQPGKPLDLSAVSRSRKNLYGTRAFALVDITRTPIGSDAAPAENGGSSRVPAATSGEQIVSVETTSPGATLYGGQTASDETHEESTAIAAADRIPTVSSAEAASYLPEQAADVPVWADVAVQEVQPGLLPEQPDDVPVRVKVAVREVQPFEIQYGASFDTERGPGAIFNIANHNSLGMARELGLQTRYDSQVHDARLYFSQPTLHSFPLETIGSVYYRQERNPSTGTTQAFNIDRQGVSIQQELKLRDHYVWTYGYRLERSRNWAPDLAQSAPPFTRVSPLTSTLTRETRDDVLDATQGAFLSQAFSFSPHWLGADSSYIKYFGQYFRYFPLQAPRRKPFTNETIRPRLVYAAGVRLGLAYGLQGEDVPFSERFFAGGSTTLRGFAQNAVGPIGVDGVPLGGEAMLTINNELRFPLLWRFDGVGFVDVGNVFDRVASFSFLNLRKDAGVGLRLRVPWFVLRVDYGVPFQPRPGESRSRLFFSIGQAF